METIGEFDVAIVGGGPGGSTLGALLARRGRKVAIVERAVFPRFFIGESLLPFTTDVWRESGVLEKIEAGDFMVKRGARFVVDETLEEQVFWFKEGLDEDHPYAFQVQRAQFDQLLLDHAREQGVTVFQPTSAQSVEVGPEFATLKTDDGEIRAQIVADASGRHTFTANLRRVKHMDPQHRKISVFAHFRDVVRCEKDEGNIIIVRFGETERGWFWMIPFHDGSNSVGVVADVDYFKSRGVTPEEFLMESLAKSRSLAPRMKNAKRINEVRSEAEFTYSGEGLAFDRLVLIGDAGAFIDPVFSSGVHLSASAAGEAAKAIDAALEAGDCSKAAFMGYERRVLEGVSVFRGFINAFYHHDFLRSMVTCKRRPLLQRSITSLLAGDVYNSHNALIPYLTGNGGAFNGSAEAAELFG